MEFLFHFRCSLLSWWHSDDDPNDGDEDFPIVSISLGMH
jgi:alkylated DNA repair dioxygenase AlkB